MALRERILDSAAACLSSHPAPRLRLRGIAAHAGVTAALLNYHFDDLDGLLDALAQERALPIWQALFTPAHESAGASLSRFLQRWTAALLRHRWLLPCLLQVAPDRCKWVAPLQQLVREAQREGTLRTDLPEDYIAMLMLAVGALPQLAATALGAGITLPSEPAAASQLTLLHLALLEKGLGAPALKGYRPRHDSGS
jgi:AcrR family transcriptional regulator